MITLKQYQFGSSASLSVWLLVILLGLAVNVPAQDEGEGVPAPADPAVEAGGNNNRADEDASFADPAGGGLGPEANFPGADVGGGQEGFAPAFSLPFKDDLNAVGFSFDEAAFEIFPESVKDDVRNLMTELLPKLQIGREKELQDFFDREGDRIATVFDQLGVERNADGLLAVGDADADAALAPAAGGAAQVPLTFPNEFADYEAYLQTLDLDPFERDYMLESRNTAEAYRVRVAQASGAQEGIREALERYRLELSEINDRFAEQFREKFLESLDRADPDGGRPDIDR